MVTVELQQVKKAFAENIYKAALANKAVLTFAETARYIGVSEDGLTAFMDAHKLPYYKVGTRVYFNRYELEKL